MTPIALSGSPKVFPHSWIAFRVNRVKDSTHGSKPVSDSSALFDQAKFYFMVAMDHIQKADVANAMSCLLLAVPAAEESIRHWPDNVKAKEFLESLLRKIRIIDPHYVSQLRSEA